MFEKWSKISEGMKVIYSKNGIIGHGELIEEGVIKKISEDGFFAVIEIDGVEVGMETSHLIPKELYTEIRPKGQPLNKTEIERLERMRKNK